VYISSSRLAVPGGTSTIHLRSTLIVLGPAGGTSWTPGQQVAGGWGSLLSALQQQSMATVHVQANPHRTILYLGDTGAGRAGAHAAAVLGGVHLKGTTRVVGCSISSLLALGKPSQVRPIPLAMLLEYAVVFGMSGVAPCCAGAHSDATWHYNHPSPKSSTVCQIT
jgi:hypothetical protein